jgi:asparagine synthase (glutamine-hydrolysing)
MFRYLGLAWDDSVPTSSARARQLGLELGARADWDGALLRPGLQVFTTGGEPGINETYSLPPDRGVVVGKLFRRNDLHACSGTNASLTRNEGRRIVDGEGRTLVREFWGRYIAFLLTASGAVCVLRDPSGTLPCFLVRYEGVWIAFPGWRTRSRCRRRRSLCG